MFRHYLKIAFRNLWKYKKQTLVSVVGLAVGFACFAIATLWIRYEMTYDGFHKNADRMYSVSTGASRYMPYIVAGHLKATFPEIAHAIPVSYFPKSKVQFNKVSYPADILRIDSSFLSMFNIKVIEGNTDFLIPESGKLAITEKKARRMFGNENPIGKTLDDGGTICAVVTGLPKHSNYQFDFLKLIFRSVEYGYNETLVELSRGIDVEAFRKKLYEHTIRKDGVKYSKITLTPAHRNALHGSGSRKKCEIPTYHSFFRCRTVTYSLHAAQLSDTVCQSFQNAAT